MENDNIQNTPTPTPIRLNSQLVERESTSSCDIKDTSALHSSSIKKVVVTGVTGQDGSHMAEYLLKNTNCMVYGTIRRLSVTNHENIEHLKKEPRFQLVNMDLTDSFSIRDVIVDLKPDYFINYILVVRKPVVFVHITDCRFWAHGQGPKNNIFVLFCFC